MMSVQDTAAFAAYFPWLELVEVVTGDILIFIDRIRAFSFMSDFHRSAV